MADENQEFSYRGRVFPSAEAMALYIASRQPVKKSAGSRIGMLDAVMLFLGAAVIVLFAVFYVPQPPGAAPANAPASYGVSEDMRTKMALVVNLSGQLCATVTSIERIYGDLYRVQCVRYRDGSGIATYEVDARAGAVK